MFARFTPPHGRTGAANCKAVVAVIAAGEAGR
jgi:hypothetical protein